MIKIFLWLFMLFFLVSETCYNCQLVDDVCMCRLMTLMPKNSTIVKLLLIVLLAMLFFSSWKWRKKNLRNICASVQALRNAYKLLGIHTLGVKSFWSLFFLLRLISFFLSFFFLSFLDYLNDKRCMTQTYWQSEYLTVSIHTYIFHRDCCKSL